MAAENNEKSWKRIPKKKVKSDNTKEEIDRKRTTRKMEKNTKRGGGILLLLFNGSPLVWICRRRGGDRPPDWLAKNDRWPRPIHLGFVCSRMCCFGRFFQVICDEIIIRSVWCDYFWQLERALWFTSTSLFHSCSSKTLVTNCPTTFNFLCLSI